MPGNLNKEEARLIALSRAIRRYGMDTFVRLEDIGTLAEYLPTVLDIDSIEVDSDNDMDVILDAYVAGFVANRLVNAGLRPADMVEQPDDVEFTEAASTLSRNQSGIDATTGEIRH